LVLCVGECACKRMGEREKRRSSLFVFVYDKCDGAHIVTGR
jgi:hypothetical protein